MLRLGPADEGPEAFFRIDADGSGLGSDAEGRIYVLDEGHQQVRVFEPNGRHRHTLGRPGDGPGELAIPTRLLTSSDGRVTVADSRKRALVRFGPDGSVLAAVPLRDYSLGSFDLRGAARRGLVFTLDDPYESLAEAMARAPRDTRLVHVPLDISSPASSPGPQEELDRWIETPSSSHHIDACNSDVTFARPLTPSQVVATGGDRIAWARGPEYVVDLVAPDGSRRSVRRALPPTEATRELAARDFGTLSIELPSHEVCEITGERAVNAAGFDPVVPWITAVRIAPDGHLFVRRRDPDALPTRRIDVFDPDGAYIGTLPEAFPLPARFHGPDTFLRVERDELNVPVVVLHRIVRD